MAGFCQGRMDIPFRRVPLQSIYYHGAGVVKRKQKERQCENPGIAAVEP